MKKIIFTLFLITALFAGAGQNSYSQTGFNTAIEYCTGTWCQWCPCGHQIIQDILYNFPNVVVIAYHGGSSDPWASYSASMIAAFGFNLYPTGVVGRRTGIIGRGGWNNQVVIQSNTIQPGVSIVISSKNYNSGTRQLTGQIISTALTNLTGSYYISYILTESNIVYPQTGNSSCPGGPNYIHYHVVKGVINGVQGDLLNSGGTWTQGVAITKTLNYTIPSGFVAENCDVNIMVYKQGSSISTDSYIQQSVRQSVTLPVGVNSNNEVPLQYSLSQNYPNPFNPVTNIKFSIPKDGNVSLKVYDMLGNEVAVYLDGFVKAGTYKAEVDGSGWSSGVYFYTLSTKDFTDTKKMVLVK